MDEIEAADEDDDAEDDVEDVVEDADDDDDDDVDNVVLLCCSWPDNVPLMSLAFLFAGKKRFKWV